MRDTGTGQKFIETKPAPKGAVYSKPKWGPYPDKNHKPPIIPRKPGMSGTTFILKGSPNMFHEIGPDYKHRPDLPKPRPGSKALSDIWDGGKGSSKQHTGHVGKGKVIGHVNPGSTQLMTKPGFVTGKMPAIRGLGGGMLGFFNFGPLESAKMKGVIPYADPNRIY
jgi:hypothetical protein